jgi:DNA-binding NarL/FixJ family response regulator
MISKGYTNSEIAKELYISVNTVKFHIKNLFSKLGATSRTELLAQVYDKYNTKFKILT